ncbi:GntR family transcriptional regulator [Paenibacillus chartarius]|uniref:GntR family transcriptional regulator n=1 Tax=Paenibacillus chartarius TaxID=747481 RepID=A0ABV6DS17_9BACL
MAAISLNQTAYEYIHNKIMHGEFLPGSMLSENELAEALSMSRTPIRGAIAQLEHEGLVVTLKNRGILVKEISMKEAMDMFEVIHTFQLYALDHMQTHGDMPDLPKMKKYLELQYEATEQRAYHLYAKYSFQFQYCLVAILGNNSMMKILDDFANKMLLFAITNFQLTPNEPHYRANKLNRSIYEALLAKDFQLLRRIFIETHQVGRERLMRTGRI